MAFEEEQEYHVLRALLTGCPECATSHPGSDYRKTTSQLPTSLSFPKPDLQNVRTNQSLDPMRIQIFKRRHAIATRKRPSSHRSVGVDVPHTRLGSRHLSLSPRPSHHASTTFTSETVRAAGCQREMWDRLIEGETSGAC